MEPCPQCQLPRELDAWRCDGCGKLFRTDFAMARSELQAELRKARRTLGWTVLMSAVAIALVVILAGYRSPFIMISLGVVIAGMHGAVIHRIGAVKSHLELLPGPKD